MVIYLAGLSGVPQELEEAAAVDGANGWTRFFRIVLPQLQPAVVIASMLMLIYGLRVFDEVIALTGGGPFNATETLSTQIWRETFVAGQFGYGSAISLILTVMITVFAIIQHLVLNGRKGRA
jgi:raffinose/stachyose/melibiose transport system permease protein